MKILNVFFMFLLTIILVVFGTMLLAVSFNLVSPTDISDIISYTYTFSNSRIILTAIGISLLLISLLVVRFSIGKLGEQRIVSFDNPNGKVTVSLSAVQDNIKRIISNIEELKDIKPKVVVNRKHINVVITATLWSDSNISSTTKKIQSLVQARLQDMFGIDVNAVVKVHVAKIADKVVKKKQEEIEDSPIIPFRSGEYKKL